ANQAPQSVSPRGPDPNGRRTATTRRPNAAGRSARRPGPRPGRDAGEPGRVPADAGADRATAPAVPGDTGSRPAHATSPRRWPTALAGRVTRPAGDDAGDAAATVPDLARPDRTDPAARGGGDAPGVNSRTR